MTKQGKNRRKGYLSLFWQFPKLTLLYLTLVEVVLYFDRGAIAAVLPRIKGNWKLRREEEGAIASIFTIGFMIASPIWAHFGMRYNMSRVVAAGLAIFSIAATCTGIIPIIAKGLSNKWGYYVFAACRFVVGVGEAGIISLGYTVVDDLAPAAYKTIYMAIIMTASPLGVASGIGITGFIAGTRWWQVVFFMEGALIFSAAILCLYIPFFGYNSKKERTTINAHEVVPTVSSASESINVPVYVDGTFSPSPVVQPSVSKKAKPYGLFTAIIPLATNPIYVCIVGVSCIYGAITGSLTFWVPSYLLLRLAQYEELTKEQQIALVSLGFSIISFFASLLGTAFGAFVVEKSGGVVGWRGVSRTMFWCVVFFTVAIPFGMIVFVIEDMPYWMIFVLFFMAIFFVFCSSSPFQVALMNSVHPNLRHFANSYQIFFLHALGDLPSPFLFGMIAEILDMRWAMIITWCALFPGLIFLALAGVFALLNIKRGAYERISESSVIT